MDKEKELYYIRIYAAEGTVVEIIKLKPSEAAAVRKFLKTDAITTIKDEAWSGNMGISDKGYFTLEEATEFAFTII